MKYLIWDFDGTLAYRDGKWSGAIVDILDERRPGHGMCREDARQYLQSGMPWHQPDRSHTHLEDADHWWESLHPLFVRVFESLGIELFRIRTGPSCPPGVSSARVMVAL